jgi:hypothetical protein
MGAIAEKSPDFASKIDSFLHPMGEILQSLVELGRTVWPIVEPVLDAALWMLGEIAGVLQEVVGWAQTAVDWLRTASEWLAETDANWNLNDSSGYYVDEYNPAFAGHNARGTRNWRGGLTWVGENGPELVDLPRGAQIYPNNESMQLSGLLPDMSSAGFAQGVSYDINNSRMSYANGGTVNYITVNGIEELDEVVNWYQSREIMGRME